MDVIVAGDGATGLTAALLLGKNGMEPLVFGTDDSSLHGAYLYNYPGIEEIHGSEFLDVLRTQCRTYGVEFHEATVTDVARDDGGFTVGTDTDTTATAPYLVLATGYERSLAERLGADFDGGAVETDKNGRTSVENLYAGGWTARNGKVQAVISAGDGAAIALDILSEERGQTVRDWDVPR